LTAIYNGEVIPDKSKLYDDNGLFLQIKKLKSGKFGMYWRYEFDFAGSRKILSYGTYPIITVTKAREFHREAIVKRAQGIDPAAEKQARKAKQAEEVSFKTIAQEWFDLPKNKLQWGDDYRARVYRVFTCDVFSHKWASRPPTEIKPTDIVKTMNVILERGAPSAAELMQQLTRSVFEYAMMTDRATGNPAAFKPSVILPKREIIPRPAITDPIRIGQLLRDIDQYHGHVHTVYLLKLSPHFMLRPVELRVAQWEEFDLDAAEWIIEATRMKGRQHVKRANLEKHRHIVTLSKQAVTLLRELYQFTGYTRYLFPSARKSKNPYLSSTTVNTALRTMGYGKDEMCAHGFRGMASTRLNEMRNPDGSPMWNPDAIERQLAHTDKNIIRRAYNRADHLEERREMMQAWGDYLDVLRAG
jgi:integrase